MGLEPTRSWIYISARKVVFEAWVDAGVYAVVAVRHCTEYLVLYLVFLYRVR